MTEMISFGRGYPHPKVIEDTFELIKRNFTRALETYGIDILGYSTKGISEYMGFVPLRALFASSYGVDVSRVFASNGALEAVAFTLLTLWTTNKKQGIHPVFLMEQCSYNRVVDYAHTLGYTIIGIPANRDGLFLEVLEEYLKNRNVAALYQISPHQNPCGYTASNKNLEQAGLLCEKYGALHLVDCAYQHMRYDGEINPHPVVTPATALFFSFSKTVCPGFKCGVGILPESFVPKITKTVSCGRLNPNYPTQAIIERSIDSGDFGQHLDEMNRFYVPRMQAMIEAIEQYFPDTFEIPFVGRPNGGAMVLVRVKITLGQEEDYRKKCLEKGVFLEKPNFWAPGFEEKCCGEYQSVFYRTPFLAIDPNEILDGIKIMKEVQDSI